MAGFNGQDVMFKGWLENCFKTRMVFESDLLQGEPNFLKRFAGLRRNRQTHMAVDFVRSFPPKFFIIPRNHLKLFRPILLSLKNFFYKVWKKFPCKSNLWPKNPKSATLEVCYA